jgi:hypothetical protein
MNTKTITLLLLLAFSVSISSQAQQQDFKVNDDQGYKNQLFSSISTDNSGNFVITWLDYRNSSENIFAQRYSSDGSALGVNFKVNDVPNSAAEYYPGPSIASDSSGNFVITWMDGRNGQYGLNPDIYAQRYSSTGDALGANFKVNNDVGTDQTAPAISMDVDGNFIIAWTDYRDGMYSNIYAQRFSGNGNTEGTNFKVNNDQASTHATPYICTDGSGNFVITWYDERNGYMDGDIYAQRYASNGTALGTNFKVNDEQNNFQQVPTISADYSGNFVITWHDYRNYPDLDIYAQRYSNDGSAQGINFKVSIDQGGVVQSYPSVSTDNSGNFVIAWRDDRNGKGNIYAQRYTNDGNTLGSNFRVTNTSDSEQSNPCIQIGNGMIYTAWTDDRFSSTADNICANILIWAKPTALSDKELTHIPSSFILSQNYPNPFNPSTKINYTIPFGDFVTILIYDALGKEVDVLVNKYQSAGSYEIEFDGYKLSSGVYIYRFVSLKYKESKKMLLIK